MKTAALGNDSLPSFPQELCGCLRVDDSADPVPLCLTSDVLSSPNSWWQLLMTGAGVDPAMTDPVYLDLVSRSEFRHKSRVQSQTRAHNYV